MIKRTLTVSLQHVYIEELVTLKVYTCQYIVIECHLGYIDILRLTRHQEHTVVEEHITHRSTSFVVSVKVWQIVCRAKALDTWNSTQTAVDMHLAINDIVPDRVQRRHQSSVAIHCHHISHTRVEVCSTNRVPHSLHLLTHWNMSLRIVTTLITLLTTNIDKLLRHLGVKLITCRIVHLHQCKLNLLVTWSVHHWLAAVVVRIALEEYSVNMLCILLRYIQPLALAGSLVICNSTLIHMTHIIELVAVIYKRVTGRS